MLAAIKDPNPVLVLLPKALLRAKGGPDERIPGEPADPDELSRLIDAPVGDRSDWQPQWPELEGHVGPIGKARLARQGITATVTRCTRRTRSRSTRRCGTRCGTWRRSRCDRLAARRRLCGAERGDRVPGRRAQRIGTKVPRSAPQSLRLAAKRRKPRVSVMDFP